MQYWWWGTSITRNYVIGLHLFYFLVFYYSDKSTINITPPYFQPHTYKLHNTVPYNITPVCVTNKCITQTYEIFLFFCSTCIHVICKSDQYTTIIIMICVFWFWINFPRSFFLTLYCIWSDKNLKHRALYVKLEIFLSK